MADQSVDKAIKLSGTGTRIQSIDIQTPDEITKFNSPEYLQSSYHELNGCVWLSTCLLIRSQDSKLADHLLNKYKANCGKYEQLRIKEKIANGNSNLNTYIRDDKDCYLDVCKVTVPEGLLNDPKKNIILPTTKGLFVVVLRDPNGGRSHTVRINSGLKIIYDCMETHDLILNVHNLNKCCGPNKNFVNFVITQELKNNRVHAKKP